MESADPEAINFRVLRDFFNAHPGLQRIVDRELSSIGRSLEEFYNFVPGLKFASVLLDQTFLPYIQRANCLENCLFQVATDCHYLSGRLHLGRQLPIDVTKLLERPLRNLYHGIIDRRLEGGRRLFGYVVRYFVQVHPDRNFCRHPRYRVTRCLRGKRGGAGNSRVHFHDAVFARLGVKGELDVATTFYAQLPDYSDCRRPQLLVFGIG